jgi:hypothetical protein
MWSALMENTVQITWGTSLTPTPLGNMEPWNTVNPNTGELLSGGESFSGVAFGTLNDSSSFDGMLCWQIDRPYPCTIAVANSFMQTIERK